MHARPIGDLIDAIDPVIDGSIKTTSEGRCPPVLIQSSGWRGDRIEVAGSVSSQFLSGLMMAAPIALARNQATSLTIEVVGELVSRPYVDLTANVMRSFGANVTLKDSAAGDSLAVSVAGSYRGASYSVEPDASAASYFWAAAAISGGTVTVTGLSRDAMQGDVGFCDVLQQMGCNVRFDADSIDYRRRRPTSRSRCQHEFDQRYGSNVGCGMLVRQWTDAGPRRRPQPVQRD